MNINDNLLFLVILIDLILFCLSVWYGIFILFKCDFVWLKKFVFFVLNLIWLIVLYLGIVILVFIGIKCILLFRLFVLILNICIW